MITILIQNNRVPYFNDKGTLRVYTGDVTTALGELFGVEEKKRKKTTVTETPSEEVVAPAE